MFHILLVEDDHSLQLLFSRTLSKNGFHVSTADSAEEALSIIDSTYIDLIITDVILPGMSGFDMIRQIRESYLDLPILVVTVKSDFLDKQEGFHSGADDYMVKPVDIHEMILRVNALLRRAKSVSKQRLTFDETELDYNSCSMTTPSGKQILPQKEFQLLYKLLSYPGQVFTRQQLLDDIWGFDHYVDSHTLDVHISRIRERIKDNPDFEIVTIRGFGYKAEKNEK